MEDKLSKGERRRLQILELIRDQGAITVNEVMERFSCSEATARRDLNLLAQSEPIIRTLGGAHYEGSSAQELPFSQKQEVLLGEKLAIAAKAASLIQEGDVIGLTGGTTTYLIAKHIKERRNLTVVTNAVNIAMELAENDELQTVLTGGVIRSKSFELCGPLAESIIDKLNIGRMFVGADGFSLTEGLTTYSELEAQIGRLMIARSREVIAVFDHTKVDRASLFTMAPLSAIHACITDRPLSKELKQSMEAMGIQLHVPSV
ncbi:DeoR/GlpR family DNA-binding transcription regulator [Paenibacillus senegalensis]|uniref:DeoR/GlpR family DNA-binding transcription regulator n=1 Tax=Paenibacillus senegalensis TaxID=1465766 RepID=UPI0002892358|nr:DeoR/GlpR family DNA-binding transcription regulator [Paenibacillus senegalensis]